MTPLQALAVVAFNLLRGSGNKLTMKKVQAWIDEHSTETTTAGLYGKPIKSWS
jgi:hypothetical protein